MGDTDARPRPAAPAHRNVGRCAIAANRHTASYALLACLALILCGCATNPVTGRSEFSLLSQAQEIRIGRDGHEAILKEYGAYDDPKLQAYVDSLGQALAKVSHLPHLEWHFTVLDDPVVNAFALPGGYIYITRGILSHLNSEAQLAGVLGHEIGHVTARHSAQRITQQQVAGLGLGLATIFSEGFRRYSQAAETALGLMLLKYGRDDENQADQLGVDYSVQAGYDPREIPATYTTLRRVGEHAGQRLPTFLSTHPDPGDREVRTRGLAQQAATGKRGLVVGNTSHLRRLEGVVFGSDPRQGYFSGDWFYHPELRFEIKFPAGWKTQNGREAVMAVEPRQRARMQLSLAEAGELSPSAFVRELEVSGKVAGTDGRAERIGGFDAWAGRLLVVSQDATRSRLAAAFIRRSPGPMFQVLGAAAETADEASILASARSFRELTDTERLTAEPDRVRIVEVREAGSFEEVVAGLGPRAIDLDGLSILNNLERAEDVFRGQLLKVVRPGRR